MDILSAAPFAKPSVFRPGIEEYAERHTTPTHPELDALAARTREVCPEFSGMMTSPAQITFLGMLASMVRAERILEAGTFTGYSALGMARVLPDYGELVTVDDYSVDDRARQLALDAFAASPYGGRVRLVEADAIAALNSETGPFDLIFLDANKPCHRTCYEIIMSRNLLAPNGVLVIDNTLWCGLVLDPPVPGSAHTDPMERLMATWAHDVVALNAHIAGDPRVTNALLTVRDGMSLIRHAR